MAAATERRATAARGLAVVEKGEEDGAVEAEEAAAAGPARREGKAKALGLPDLAGSPTGVRARGRTPPC